MFHAKDSVHHDLEVMACLVITVEINAACILEQPVHLYQAWLHELQIPFQSAFPLVVERTPVLARIERRVGCYQVYTTSGHLAED